MMKQKDGDTVTTNLRIPRETYEKLRTLAFNERVTQNSILVKALEKYLKEK